MKKTFPYAALAAAITAAAALVIIGCNGDLGSGNEKMDDFLEKFRGVKDETILKYTVRFDANGGTGTPPESKTVRAGIKITLPNGDGLSNTPYVFVGWLDKSGVGQKYRVGYEYQPTSNVTLYADWQDDGTRYEVMVSSAGTNASGGSSYLYGETVTIYAGAAPEGQRFVNWTATPTVSFASANSPTTTFKMPANAVTVKANFEPIPADQYAVTVISVGAGMSGGKSYAAGTTVTINAGSDPFAHRFQNWTVTDGGVGLANANSRTTTFTMPANAVTVTANFVEVPTYKVTVLSEGINASKDSSYREGDEVTINAGTAPANQRFKGWTVTSGGVTLGDAESATTKFIMSANDVKVMANFGANTYMVTVIAGKGALGGGEYSPGATVNITAGTALAGFVFKNWTSSNNNVVFADANSTTTTFIMPSAAVTVVVNFSGSGTFTDSRDSKPYKTVIIGGKMWMAENMNYQTLDSSWCYDNNPDSCAKYGRLYAWNAAEIACPTDWHLPSRREWGDLTIAAGGIGTYGDGGTAGKKLKSTSGWYNNGNGTDDFGFFALPGDHRDSDGKCNFIGKNGHWWTDTEYSSGNAYVRTISYGSDVVSESYRLKICGFSVRCVADD